MSTTQSAASAASTNCATECPAHNQPVEARSFGFDDAHRGAQREASAHHTAMPRMCTHLHNVRALLPKTCQTVQLSPHTCGDCCGQPSGVLLCCIAASYGRQGTRRAATAPRDGPGRYNPLLKVSRRSKCQVLGGSGTAAATTQRPCQVCCIHLRNQQLGNVSAYQRQRTLMVQ